MEFSDLDQTWLRESLLRNFDVSTDSCIRITGIDYYNIFENWFHPTTGKLIFQGATALHFAAQSQHSSFILRLLLSRDDLEVDCKDALGRTPLIWAAKVGNLDALRSLSSFVEDGRIDINIEDSDSLSPVLHAVGRVHISTVEWLLKCRDFDQGKFRHRSLLAALKGTEYYWFGYPELINYLLELGVELNVRDEANRMPLHILSESIELSV